MSTKIMDLLDDIMHKRRCNEHQRLEEIQNKLNQLEFEFTKFRAKTNQEHDSMKSYIDSCYKSVVYHKEWISALQKRVSDLLDDNDKEKVLRMMSELNEKIDSMYLEFKGKMNSQSEKLEHLQKSCNDTDDTGFNFSEYDHMMSFVYQPGRVYRISCKTGVVTDFVFNKDEKIDLITGGFDDAAWEIKETTVKDVGHIHVKPLSNDAATNIIINTDKRSYQLFLKADSYCSYLIVKWYYSSEGSDGNCKDYGGGEERERESD